MKELEVRNLNEEEINEIESKIGYVFKDKRLLSIAFRRKSYTEEHPYGKNIPNNETLEFYGDSALNLIVVKANAIIAAESYKKNESPKRNEEALTHFVSNYTDKDILSSIIESMDISKYLIMGKGDIQNEVHKELSVMEDLFEAIVGAMWFDNELSIDAINDYVIKMLDLRLDKEEFYEKNDFVKLKEFIDKNPDFQLVKPHGYYELYYKGSLVTWGGNIDFRQFVDVNGYMNLIMNARLLIQQLKEHNLWIEIKKIDTDGVDKDNAINKLQELFQQKIITIKPEYSDGELDRTVNLWNVQCKYIAPDYQVTMTGSDRIKVEAKKLAAYYVYMDLAKHYNE